MSNLRFWTGWVGSDNAEEMCLICLKHHNCLSCTLPFLHTITSSSPVWIIIQWLENTMIKMLCYWYTHTHTPIPYYFSINIYRIFIINNQKSLISLHEEKGWRLNEVLKDYLELLSFNIVIQCTFSDSIKLYEVKPMC